VASRPYADQPPRQRPAGADSGRRVRLRSAAQDQTSAALRDVAHAIRSAAQPAREGLIVIEPNRGARAQHRRRLRAQHVRLARRDRGDDDPPRAERITPADLARLERSKAGSSAVPRARRRGCSRPTATSTACSTPRRPTPRRSRSPTATGGWWRRCGHPRLRRHALPRRDLRPRQILAAMARATPRVRTPSPQRTPPRQADLIRKMTAPIVGWRVMNRIADVAAWRARSRRRRLDHGARRRLGRRRRLGERRSTGARTTCRGDPADRPRPARRAGCAGRDARDGRRSATVWAAASGIARAVRHRGAPRRRARREPARRGKRDRIAVYATSTPHHRPGAVRLRRHGARRAGGWHGRFKLAPFDGLSPRCAGAPKGSA